NDGEVRGFSNLDRAKSVGHAAPSRGNRRERREGVILSQTAVQGEAQVFAEIPFVAQSVSRQRNLQSLLAQKRGVFRRPVPGAELVERDLFPVLFLGQLRQLWKIERHDKRRSDVLRQIGPAPFLAAGKNVKVQIQFASQARGAVQHQR